VFTDPLASNKRKDTPGDTQTARGFMGYATDKVLSAIIYIPSFINSGIQILIVGLHREIETVS
jgi:hypothetical protein